MPLDTGVFASRFAPGTLLGGGKFQIEGVLGEGAMGVVYKALQLSIDRPVAIKVLLESRLHALNARERFKIEAWAVARVHHPNVVTLLDADVTDHGLGYLVFEYLSGRPLSKERGRAMEAGRAVKIARQVCRALGAAHMCGIVHRDLKPGNIQLVEVGDDPDFVKLLDFGIAKLLDARSDRPPLTAAEQVLGTLRYMAPEQIRGLSIDGRADLYSLGCVLFQLLTGAAPFRAPSGPQLIEQHLVEPPPRFRDMRPEAAIDPRLEAIVQILLAKRPEDRIQSAEAVEAALAECVDGRAAADLAGAGESASASGTRSEVISFVSAPSTRAERPPLASAPPLAMAAFAPARPWIARLAAFATGTIAVVLAVIALTRADPVAIAPIAQPRVQPVQPITPEKLPVIKPKPKRSIRLSNLEVVAGTMDHDRAAAILEAREAELARCHSRTQIGALARRTLRLFFASSHGRRTLVVEPEDPASGAFLACVNALDPPLALEKSGTPAIAIVAVDLAPATTKGAP